MNIKLHIERLILDGVPIEGDIRSLRMAIETELTRLLAQSGVAPGLQTTTALSSLRGGAIQLSPDNRAEALGRQIAGGVHKGITKSYE